MVDRERKIRELVERLTRPDSHCGAEYPLLSLEDTQFLLQMLDDAREDNSPSFVGWFRAHPIPRLSGE